MGLAIQPDMTVEDLVHAYPSAVRVLQDLGIMCIMCGEPVWGTLAELVQERRKDLAEVMTALRRIGGSQAPPVL